MFNRLKYINFIHVWVFEVMSKENKFLVFLKKGQNKNNV